MEQAGHLAIDGLVHPRDLFHQLFWGFGIILRVGAKMLDECFPAFISGLFGDLDHFGADAGDFLQPQFVDLVCGQVGRCFLTDAEIIIFAATRLC